MAKNKVVFDGNTLIDLTDTTATASDVAQGKYFYTNAGVRTQGTASGGGSSKNVQIAQSTSRATSTAYTKLASLTCSATGTYDVYWTCTRTSTSGTWGSQLYIAGSSYGSVEATFSNHIQNVHLSNVSITKNQEVAVYARSRGSNYYAYVSNLVIIEK